MRQRCSSPARWACARISTRPFARCLAANGVHALTFDYRGMGWSRRGSLRGFEADVSRWAERDLDAMLHEAQRAARRSCRSSCWATASAARSSASLPGNATVRAALTVTAGSGYYKLQRPHAAAGALLWFVAIPLLTPLFGYFPGKRAAHGGRPAARRGAGSGARGACTPSTCWPRASAYATAFRRVRAPILGYSFEDDDLITRPGHRPPAFVLPRRAVERRHVAPAERREAHRALRLLRRAQPRNAVERHARMAAGAGAA